MGLLNILKTEGARAKLAKKNIVLLFVNKGLAALIALQLIPAAIGYVDATQYGIWITLSSIVAWMVYFDMGLTHGFRNNFAIAKAKNDTQRIKELVSTSYALLALIFTTIMVAGLIANYWISWSSILKVDPQLEGILRNVFIIIIIFMSLQMVLNISTTLLIADQKPAFAGIIVTTGQFLSLLTIYLLVVFTEGSLELLAIALIGLPVIVLKVATVIMFQTKFKEYAPSIKSINWRLTKDIVGLGGKFFAIQLSMLFVFQFSNIIISRVMGVEDVTIFNIANRYFSIIYVIMGVVFLPFWSAFTDAYTQGELGWMKSMYEKLSKIWLLTIPLFLMLVAISPYVYQSWLAKNLAIDFYLSVAMGVNIVIFSRANLYMYCINGTGKVMMQMLIYLFFAIVSIPLMYYLTQIWGYFGILTVTSLVYLCQAVSGHIQLKMILNRKEYGIWGK